MKKYIFIIALLFMQNAYAHSGVGNYDAAVFVCASNPGTQACDYITAHNAAHAADAADADEALLQRSSAGGFRVTYGGDELLQLSGGGLFRALGAIFLVVFSLIAIFLGFRKLQRMFSGKYL